MRTELNVYWDEALNGLQAGGRRVSLVSYALSYRYGGAYRPEHITEFCEPIKERLERKRIPFACSWVLERKGGREHFHVYFLVPHRTQMLSATLKPRRGKVLWTHGWAGLERARSIPAMLHYLTKYSTKECLPKGARLFATGGTDKSWRQVARWCGLPRYVKEKTFCGEPCSKAPGGGWFSRLTGEIFKSPWKWDGPGKFSLLAAAQVTYEQLRQLFANARRSHYAREMQNGGGSP